jgi:hypothetical protein
MPEGYSGNLYGATFINDSLWGFPTVTESQQPDANPTKTSYVERRIGHNIFVTRSGSTYTVDGVKGWEATIPKRLQNWEPLYPTRWYRVDGVMYAAPLGEFGNPIPGGSRADVVVQHFYVIRYTPKGVWLDSSVRLADADTPPPKQPFKMAHPYARFQAYSSNKKFACPTLEEAYESFFRRKEREVSIYRGRISVIDRQVEIASRQLERYMSNGNQIL